MKKFVQIIVVIAVLLSGFLAFGQSSGTIVNQGSPGKYGPWPVNVSNTTPINVAVTSGGGTIAYSPAVPTNVALSANVSGAITGIPAGSPVRIVCDGAARYRVGTGTPVAVATDNLIGAGAVERFNLKSNETAIAFIATASTTCQVAVTTGP